MMLFDDSELGFCADEMISRGIGPRDLNTHYELAWNVMKDWRLLIKEKFDK